MFKKRQLLKEDEKQFLANYFQTNKNPRQEERFYISDAIGVPEVSVRIWFQNERAHQKKLKNQNPLFLLQQDFFVTYLYSDCNALCIKPYKTEVEAYKKNNFENYNVVIKSYYNFKTGLYKLGY